MRETKGVSWSGRRALAVLGAAAALAGCGRSAAVQTGPSLPLRRVVVYRNGVGYFERQGHVTDHEVNFRVLQREVGDFLATLAVMERGGSTVRAAAFPLPEERPDGAAPPPGERRTVRLALDGGAHDLAVGYTVETPIWRPSYRLVFGDDRAEVQAWGIVQNLSGEDWRDVRLSLVAGAPVSFRSELATPMVPRRPVVTDQGAVIDAVPTGETTLAQGGEASDDAPAEETEADGDADGSAPGLGAAGTGMGGGGVGEGTIGMGHVGTLGHGAGAGTGQGYGSGAGGGLRGRGAREATVRAAPPEVSGLLSTEAIRRVVLRNLGQFRYCHERSLAQDPSASGRITVRFVIGPTGAVLGSAVASSTHSVPSTGPCVANVMRRLMFPAPEGGGTVTVNYPFNFDAGDGEGRGPAAPTARTASPRNVAALAAVAAQGGATRYDLPQPVTVPDRSATMVMLAARDVPGRQMFLFAPDPAIAASSTHPFRVARFENRTGALLERGPIAIFEAGAYLGQGMLEALPDGATATIPFSLDRALALESEVTTAVEGSRLVAMRREALTLERFRVTRTTYRARNGGASAARVMVRHALDGERLHEPPAGTEETAGGALVPLDAPARDRGTVVVTTRSPFTVQVELGDEHSAAAIEQYLRDAAAPAATAQSLRDALALRQQIEAGERERNDLEQRRGDLQRGAEETRANLQAIQRNPQAADLRARLTARLGRVATDLDQLTRRIVELDTQVSERRVRLTEAVREVDLDVNRPAPPPR